MIMNALFTFGVLTAAAVIFIGLKNKQLADQRRREARLADAKWLASPKVQKALKRGPEDKVDRRVFLWLKRHEGQKVQVVYRAFEREGIPEWERSYNITEEAQWTVTAPRVDPEYRTNKPIISWNAPPRGQILPSRTYHEASEEGNCLIYKLGWGAGRDPQMGGHFAVSTLEDVDAWNIFTFTPMR